MIVPRACLLFSFLRGVAKAIAGALKLLFALLGKLRLRALALYAALGAVIVLAGGMRRGGWFFYAYHAGVGLLLLLRILPLLRKLVPKRKEKKEKSAGGGAQILRPEPAEVPAAAADAGARERVTETNKGEPFRPKYYRVAQDARYVMAEYPDRYELYLELPGGEWKYIRSDPKTKETL